MQDKELEAMKGVYSSLAELDDAARARVMRWVSDRFNLSISGPSSADQKGALGNKEMEVGGRNGGDAAKFDVSLASYIRTKNAAGNQTVRFLVTADWLRRRGQTLTSGAVGKALVDNQQSRLSNPADCLNKNVAKGLCEKTKDGFYITPEGLKELGSTE